MSLQRCRRPKKKVEGVLDYDRLSAVFGRTWSYITPAYFYEELDLFDIAKLIPYVSAEDYASCWIMKQKQKNKGLQEAMADGVISRSK